MLLVQGQCTLEQAAVDSCPYTIDGECDVDAGFCDENTDCYDCDSSFLFNDPCYAASSTNCATCTSTLDIDGNPCAWCPHWDLDYAYCTSSALIGSQGNLCTVSPGFVSTCPSCNVGYDEQLDKFLQVRDKMPDLTKAIVLDREGLHGFTDPQIMFLEDLSCVTDSF